MEGAASVRPRLDLGIDLFLWEKWESSFIIKPKGVSVQPGRLSEAPNCFGKREFFYGGRYPRKRFCRFTLSYLSLDLVDLVSLSRLSREER